MPIADSNFWYRSEEKTCALPITGRCIISYSTPIYFTEMLSSGAQKSNFSVGGRSLYLFIYFYCIDNLKTRVFCGYCCTIETFSSAAAAVRFFAL